MDFSEYIRPELLVLVPVLYLIGSGIKKSFVRNCFIPFILGGVSVVLCCLWVCSEAPMSNVQEVCAGLFSAVTQGILLAGASVYGNQLLKQFNNKE